MKRNALWLLFVVMAMMACLAACGGGDDDKTEDGDITPADGDTTPTDGDTTPADGDSESTIQEPGTPVGSCSIPGSSGIDTCSDYSNLSGAVTAQVIKEACQKTSGATWADSGCDHTKLAGGCNMPNQSGYTMVVWYLKSTVVTEELVKTTCSNMKGTYIAP